MCCIKYDYFPIDIILQQFYSHFVPIVGAGDTGPLSLEWLGQDAYLHIVS